jgi:ABC-type glycerol-3-phosphate transport system substrate-binding protein
VDFKTGEIFINDDKAVTALQFMADLVVQDKLTPPEVRTWEFDDITAGGQRDRYMMAQTFAPYMTLMNDPGLSKTGGNWFADTVPGYTDKSQSRTWVDGHFLAVSKYAKNVDWSIEFIRMACSKEWQLRSMERGNAPPRGSVLNDPAMAEKLGWPPTPRAPSRPASPRLPIRHGARWSWRCARAYQKPCKVRRPASRRSTRWLLTGNAPCAAPASGAPEAIRGSGPELHNHSHEKAGKCGTRDAAPDRLRR